MIEQMPPFLIKLAQFAYILWPIFIVTAFFYSFYNFGEINWLQDLGQRLRRNLLFTWLVLFFIWVITRLTKETIPTLLPEPANSIIFFSGLGTIFLIEIYKLHSFPFRIKARMDLHASQAINDLNRLSPADFEELVAETFRTLGYEARRTGHTGDHGIDVELRTKSGKRWIMQCKRYRTSVGEGIVRDLYGVLISEKASRAILVTSAEITPPAETWARGKPIYLIDGKDFLKLIERARQKAAGSPFERFTSWLERLIKQYQTPPALRKAPLVNQQTSIDETRPNRVGTQLDKPVEPITLPICPRCQITMVHHPSHPGRNLYRCQNYPSCRVVTDNHSNQ